MVDRWFWTEERVEQLKALVVEGHSYSRIARIMGCASRNMPLCKFNRLKALDPTLQHPYSTNQLKMRKPRIPSTNKVKLVVPKTPDLPKPKAEDVVPLDLEGELITFENITRTMCRYPIGDPFKADFRFCGHPHKHDSAYCEAHAVLCYQPRSEVRRGKRVTN